VFVTREQIPLECAERNLSIANPNATTLIYLNTSDQLIFLA